MLKKWMCRFLAVSLVLVCVELISWITFAFLAKRKGITYIPVRDRVISVQQKRELSQLRNGEFEYFAYDPVLGWALKPHGASGLYRANGLGIRSEREYPKNPAEGTVRIAAFGDSFVHGDEVSNTETWEAQLEAADPLLEVLNFGVGGYGIDQAYLRYLQDGVRFSPQIVLIGWTTVMLNRSVSIFNPFMTGKSKLPLAKPRFIIKDNKLELIPNPFQDSESFDALMEDRYDFSNIIRHDRYYQRLIFQSPGDVFGTVRLTKLLRRMMIESKILKGQQIIDYGPTINQGTEIFRVSVAIYKKFYEDVMAQGSIPIIVIFPDGLDIMAQRKHNRGGIEPFLSIFREEKMEYINLMEGFAEIADVDLAKYFAPKHHYSAEGNKL